jgi:osmotically-inducible protein OsmY
MKDDVLAVLHSEEGEAERSATGIPGIDADKVAWLLRDDQRGNADLRNDVVSALMFDSTVPLTVDAHVKDGIVTLTGTVTWDGEREDAKVLVGCVPGVLGILDEIRMTPGPADDDTDIGSEIVSLLERIPSLEGAELWVETPCHGTVVLSGAVESWTDHDQAVVAVWSVPGVAHVEDCVLVQG